MNTSKIKINYRGLLIWTSFIGQYENKVEGEGDVIKKRVVGDNVNLASCEYHFIRVHKNLVQHPRGFWETNKFLEKI